MHNPLGLDGIGFVEFSAADPTRLERLFAAFGFSHVMRHVGQSVDYLRQGDIHLLVNTEPGSYADRFRERHGPSLSSMGWRAEDPERAAALAVERGARPAAEADRDYDLPAIYGIGESLIYFVPPALDFGALGFAKVASKPVAPKGFTRIDHLTNNVPRGTMQEWAAFYREVFGFTDVRYFDIRGVKTGLTSFALRSPCGSFCIPINEGTEEASQINEYLREYRGPGVQHLAFLTDDIVASVAALKGEAIETLTIDDDYYASVFDRVPGVTENHEALRRHGILVDGDEHGYLLQIFTKNLIGPIFIEIIQRKNHHAFGEGNFGALFRSIEKDQEARGTI